MPGGGEAGDDTGCGDIGYIMVNSICHIGGNVIYCQQGEPYSHRRLYPSGRKKEGGRFGFYISLDLWGYVAQSLKGKRNSNH